MEYLIGVLVSVVIVISFRYGYKFGYSVAKDNEMKIIKEGIDAEELIDFEKALDEE